AQHLLDVARLGERGEVGLRDSGSREEDEPVVLLGGGQGGPRGEHVRRARALRADAAPERDEERGCCRRRGEREEPRAAVTALLGDAPSHLPAKRFPVERRRLGYVGLPREEKARPNLVAERAALLALLEVSAVSRLDYRLRRVEQPFLREVSRHRRHR